MRGAELEYDTSYLQRVKNIHDVCGEYDYTMDGISDGGDANSDTWHRTLPMMQKPNKNCFKLGILWIQIVTRAVVQASVVSIAMAMHEDLE